MPRRAFRNWRSSLAYAESRGFCGDGTILASYVLLAVVMTYPMVRQFGAAIPGDGFDGWQNYWNLWWVKTALLQEHRSPFFTDLLFHPTGVSLLFHTLNPFNGLISLPLQMAFGLFFAYNSVVLFSFAMGGFGAYLLTRRILGHDGGVPRFLRGGRLPAFVAGVIFTFSPFHFAHLLGHMQVISLEWIPFYALYLLRIVEDVHPDDLRRDKDSLRSHTTFHVSRFTFHVPRSRAPVDVSIPRDPGASRLPLHNIALAALFLVLIGLCDLYYVLYCLILTVVVLFWAMWRAWRRTSRGRQIETRPLEDLTGKPREGATVALGRALAGVAAVWVLFGLVLSPLLVPMAAEARRATYMVPDPEQSRALSADLAAFVTPQEFHPLWGAWARERATMFPISPAEHQVFAGFTVLVLAAVGLWAGRRRIGPWPLVLLIFFILALGPSLRIAGRTALLPGGGEIALPYRLLVRVVPFMEITRSVSRFDVMVMLALAVLAAFGLQAIRERRPALSAGMGTRGSIVGALALGLILFEFAPIPYPMSPPDTPQWYATLAKDIRSGAVLNLPMNWDRPGYLLYQTVHGKPLTVAYISRDDPRTLVERVPVLQHLRHLGPDIIEFDLAAQGTQVLRDLGVRWVVLDRYKMPLGDERTYTDAAARQIFGRQPPAYEDGRITVYEVTEPSETAPYLILGQGWQPWNRDRASRSFQGEASVTIQAPRRGKARLRVELSQGSAPLDAQTSEVSENLRGLAPLDASETDGVYEVPLELQPGRNEVELRTRAPGDRAVVASLALEP